MYIIIKIMIKNLLQPMVMLVQHNFGSSRDILSSYWLAEKSIVQLTEWSTSWSTKWLGQVGQSMGWLDSIWLDQ